MQTRLLTIADSYDALTATGRPYKRAVPVERVLDIVRDEARDGALGSALLTAFIEARVVDAVRSDAVCGYGDAEPTPIVRRRPSRHRQAFRW